jgi:hypothetical protein
MCWMSTRGTSLSSSGYSGSGTWDLFPWPVFFESPPDVFSLLMFSPEEPVCLEVLGPLSRFSPETPGAANPPLLPTQCQFKRLMG